MNSQYRPSYYIGSLAIHSIILGPFAALCYLLCLHLGQSDFLYYLIDNFYFFFFGSFVCTMLSFGFSIIIYLPGIKLVINQTWTWRDNFKIYLPVLIIIFPVFGTIIFLLLGISHIGGYGIIISAYLTSVLGWYMITRTIDKKLNNSKYEIQNS